MIESNENNILKYIADHLIINSLGVHDLGLYTGKMGITIFFYHYSRFKNIDIYNDFADSLLEEIIQDLDTSISINFKDGLSGIGWGIQYLIENQFVKSEDDEILSDFDDRILEYDFNKIFDKELSLDDKGILYYILSRVFATKCGANSTNRIVEKLDLDILKKNCVLHFGNIYPSVDSILNLSLLRSLWSDILFDRNSINKIPLGINKGLAGIGLNILL